MKIAVKKCAFFAHVKIIPLSFIVSYSQDYRPPRDGKRHTLGGGRGVAPVRFLVSIVFQNFQYF